MNKPVYLGLSILELSTILIYKVWYDYEKPKYGEKPKLPLCEKCLNTEFFLVRILPHSH